MNANREIQDCVDQLTKAILWQAVTNLMAFLIVMVVLAIWLTK